MFGQTERVSIDQAEDNDCQFGDDRLPAAVFRFRFGEYVHGPFEIGLESVAEVEGGQHHLYTAVDLEQDGCLLVRRPRRRRGQVDRGTG